jgi:DNA-binding transcriptional MerR regulator
MTAQPPSPQEDHELTLDALCDAAGVTVRTVRYYISEGLLPPPEGHGVQARYSQEHLDRLHVIARLKEQYLPLREIRRSLDATTPREIAEAAGQSRQVVTMEDAVAPPPAAAPPTYTETNDRLGFASGVADEPMRARRRVADRPSSAADYIAETLGRTAPIRRQPPSRPQPAPDHEANWKRIPITDDAELVIEEQAWNRRREQLESLVTWAQKILKGS